MSSVCCRNNYVSTFNLFFCIFRRSITKITKFKLHNVALSSNQIAFIFICLSFFHGRNGHNTACPIIKSHTHTGCCSENIHHYNYSISAILIIRIQYRRKTNIYFHIFLYFNTTKLIN